MEELSKTTVTAWEKNLSKNHGARGGQSMRSNILALGNNSASTSCNVETAGGFF